MPVKGVKEIGSGEDVFFSLVESRESKGQVGTLITLNQQNKKVDELMKFFGDGSVFFCPGISKKSGMQTDTKGRLCVRADSAFKIKAQKSECEVEKSTSDKPIIVKEYHSFPIARVYKGNCKKVTLPARLYLNDAPTACPPNIQIHVATASTSSQLVAISYDGAVYFCTSISTDLGLDLTSEDRMIKYRGEAPTVAGKNC
jgi:hypothetical protein